MAAAGICTRTRGLPVQPALLAHAQCTSLRGSIISRCGSGGIIASHFSVAMDFTTNRFCSSFISGSAARISSGVAKQNQFHYLTICQRGCGAVRIRLRRVRQQREAP